MNHKKVIKRASLLFIGSVLFLSPFESYSQDEIDTAEVQEEEVAVISEEDDVEVIEEDSEAAPVVALVGNAENGMALFQGDKRFANGGPTCVTCHNVTNDEVIPGGLFTKDLTEVYERMGEGLNVWLMAPPYPAMASSYNNNPLTEQERTDLTAFFKKASEEKDSQEANDGYSLFYLGGGFGLLGILVLIQILWGKRKRKMVKEDIFKRQNKAWDAKF